MGNIAIIPARSGSKGLRDKNIMSLNGIPLLAYSIRTAEASGLFEEIMVSTDSRKYAEVAIEYGANVPFLRSAELSGDFVGSWDVVEEVLTNYKNMGKCFETVCLLQPTSPLRGVQDIIRGYKLFYERKADAITSVCEMGHSPLWSMELPEDHSMVEFRNRLPDNLPRQRLKQYYRINGALYIRKISYNKDIITIHNKKEYALLMDRKDSVDIDTQEDFEWAEFLLAKRGKQ